jgi:hypothetical protein
MANAGLRDMPVLCGVRNHKALDAVVDRHWLLMVGNPCWSGQTRKRMRSCASALRDALNTTTA